MKNLKILQKKLIKLEEKLRDNIKEFFIKKRLL